MPDSNRDLALNARLFGDAIAPNIHSLYGLSDHDRLNFEIPLSCDCGSFNLLIFPGKAHHARALRCGNCDSFIKWLSKGIEKSLIQRGVIQ